MGCGSYADWIEHVLNTNGDPYLKTPEDEMSFVVRNMLDVYATAAACFSVVLVIVYQAFRMLLKAVQSKAGSRKISQKRERPHDGAESSVPKVKAQ